MSFIALATEYSNLPGGGRRITRLDPLQETTVAPYPVNSEATIAVAKAFGLSPAEEHSHEDNMTQSIDELLAKALEARQAETKTEPEGVTKEELGSVLLDFQTKINESVEAAVQKAMPVRGEGAGRKGGLPAGEAGLITRDSDPLKYIAKKAMSGEEMDEIDMKLLYAITWKALTDGLSMNENEDESGFDEIQKLIA